MSTQIADLDMSRILLANSIHNETYASKVLPAIDIEHFTDDTERAVAYITTKMFRKHGKVPVVAAVVAEMRETMNMNNLDKHVINDIFGTSLVQEDQGWLLEASERFIKRRRTAVAFEKTFGEFEENEAVENFYQVFQEAASFSFNDSVGVSLVEDASSRHEEYSQKVVKTAFGIKMLDKVTLGGMENGTLNVVLAPTNAGKSLFMGDIATKAAMAGKKVLIISLEMAEIKIIERVEANLMNVPIGEVRKLNSDNYYKHQNAYLDTMRLNGGDIRFIQYPTKCADAGDFRNFLTDCKNKMNLEFDLIVIDYLNICRSMNAPKGSASYAEIKSIAEELRAMAIEWDLPILTATQTNRNGQDASDLSLTDVSESHGLAATADFFIAIIVTEEWSAQGKIQIKQLKSRYGDKGWYNKFFIGMDKTYMRLYDIAEDVQNTLPENKNKPKPAFVAESFDLTTLG
jgi:archaellum biogenesis ATPase FlaH